MNLNELTLRIEKPMRWSESYKLYGENKGNYTLTGDDRFIKQYTYGTFFAECLIACEHSTKVYEDVQSAVFAHFMHCAQEHGYIFPENELRLRAEDTELQEIITLSCLYGLKMPEYDDHTACIKQYREAKVVCAVHKGNEYKQKHWLGYL